MIAFADKIIDHLRKNGIKVWAHRVKGAFIRRSADANAAFRNFF
jgi:hypothetical protein